MNNTLDRISDTVKKRGAKALFRYQGGKQRLCKFLVSLFPMGICCYFEPFIGAGSMFLELRNKGFRGPAFLGDWNPAIVNVHQVIATDPDGFEAAYRIHIERHCRDYFYFLRDLDTSGWTPVERAARTVYISKTAFHGLLRVDRQGKIVSTYGTGELSRVFLDGERIRKASEAFRGADIRQGDFGWIESLAESGDFVFLDPPYVGGNVAYSAEGFGGKDQQRLLQVCRNLTAKGVRFMQTNSDRPLVRELYRAFHLLSVSPAPAIGRGGVGRQPIGEVVITNYEPEANATGEFEVAA